MRRRHIPFFVAVLLSVAALCAQIACSQPAPAPAPKPATDATVLQVMRGVLFPASNVVFAVKRNDPEKVAKAEDPATATDPLKSAYGGWGGGADAGPAPTQAATPPGRPRARSRPQP